MSHYYEGQIQIRIANGVVKQTRDEFLGLTHILHVNIPLFLTVSSVVRGRGIIFVKKRRSVSIGHQCCTSPVCHILSTLTDTEY